MDTSRTNKNILISNEIYPEAADIFSAYTESLDKIKDKAIYVIDTNALLLPYTSSSKSIEEIKKVYKQLLDKKKLFIPAKVAREYAKNRPEKIKQIFSKLSNKVGLESKHSFGKYPLLSDLESYQEALEIEKDIDAAIKKYKEKLRIIQNEIKSWKWNDPLSIVYNNLFNESTIVELKEDEAIIKEQLNYRYENKIPPGYKDGGKPDDGIGDFLIWQTILQIAKEKKKDIIFVSGDVKSDWFHKSDSQALYPRYELIAEFRSKAVKKSFHIIKLSELLELYGADKYVVKELEDKELVDGGLDNVIQLSDFSKIVMAVIANYEIRFRRYNIILAEDSSFNFYLNGKKDIIGVSIYRVRDMKSLRQQSMELIEVLIMEATRAKYDRVQLVLVFEREENLKQMAILDNLISQDSRNLELPVEVISGLLTSFGEFVSLRE